MWVEALVEGVKAETWVMAVEWVRWSERASDEASVEG